MDRTYVSERITNIADLELCIQKACDGIESLREKISEESPSLEIVSAHVKEIQTVLQEAKNFEFHIERKLI